MKKMTILVFTLVTLMGFLSLSFAQDAKVTTGETTKVEDSVKVEKKSDQKEKKKKKEKKNKSTKQKKPKKSKETKKEEGKEEKTEKEVIK